MGKGKKAGKRISKKQLVQQLEQFFSSQPGKKLTLKDIFRALHLDTHPLKMLAMDIMEEMAWDDFITKKGENAYQLNTKGQVQEGTFVRKPNGKNSFIADGSDKPIFVAERNSMSALTGDRVKVSFMARRQKHIKEAQVIEILSRAKDTFVGRLRVDRDIAFCVTQNSTFVQDILIPKKRLKGGKSDDKVLVKILQWPDENHKNPIGEVVDVLGKTGENNAEMCSILAQYGLPYKYPKNVEDAAEKITGEITPEDVAEREDFRDTWTCTIDPADAKDFDDALSIKKLDEGLYQVGVHIADVSHYVTEGSIIDREAVKRATSVYLVDRTIPMLPERLCNFVCSLRPNEDKLTFSVIFDLDEDANVKRSRIVHTIIRSNRRYAYEEAQQVLEDNGVVDGQGQPAPDLGAAGYKDAYGWELCTLDRLAKKLREKRFKDGSVKFDTEELHFDVDEKGHPTRCYFKRSKDANKLIEEFMLLANRTVAESVGRVPKGKKTKVFPYRIHDNPDPEKMETLRQFIVKFGYKVKTDGTRGAMAKSINKLMDECEGKREQKLIQSVALRAMMKAKYSVHNIGHFGLGFEYYTHFTSPIRRYPDMMVHRLLARYLAGGKPADKTELEDLCARASDREVVAAEAERASIKYKMVEFMKEHIGEEFEGHISGLTEWGVYVELDETHIEGMSFLRDIEGDFFTFDEQLYEIIGRSTGIRMTLGSPVRIRVKRADLQKRQLDFELLLPGAAARRTEEPRGKGPKVRTSSRRKGR